MSVLESLSFSVYLLIGWLVGLMWGLPKKYGKHVVDCNESYTSKTRSWDGVIDDNLGGKKSITDGKIIVDRDINGARGILLKQLNKVA